MLDKLSLLAIEKGMNRYVALDPHTKARLESLSDKIVNITFITLGKHIELQVHITQHGIRLTPMDKSLLADTYISTTPLGCIKLISAPPDVILSDEHISISGDIGLGQTIKQIFDEMQVDWQAPVANVLGDSAAHQISNIARGIKKNAQKMLHTTKENVSEYVTEELNLSPHPFNVAYFLDSIDTLRDDAARLKARIGALEAKISKSQDESA